VLRLLVTQPHVVVSTRPRFAQRLGLVRHIQLERLNPTAVQGFVTAALADEAAASAALRRRMADHPSLLEAMCTPMLMHMAIEAQRGDAAGSGGDLGSSHEGALVGLYQRMEQRFVQQLVRRCGVAADSASDVWASCSRLASQIALAGCAAGSAVVAWPADAAPQRELLTGVRLLDVLASGEVEFAHRSWQEWFAARAVTADLAAGLDLSAAAVAALRRPENNMLRRFVLALADCAASADKAVAALWDGGAGGAAADFSPAALQPLAEAVVGCPHAPALAVRGAFTAKAAGVCAAVRTPPHVRDPLFDNGAFWVVADAVTGGEQTAWAADRVAHFAASLWVGKSPVPALAGLDVLAHVQPRSDAVAKCLRAAAGVWNVDVRVKATLQLLVSGAAGAAGKDALVRTVVEASGDLALRLAAWGWLSQPHGSEPFVADVGSTVLCQRSCPPSLAVAVASSLPAASLVSEALDVCSSLPGLSDRVRRDVLAERLMWRRGLDPAALRYDASWTLQHVAACAGQLHLLPPAAELARQPVATTSHGWTLLHCAVAGRSPDAVRLLAAHDRLCAAPDSDGRLPIHLAAMAGRLQVLVALRGTCTGAHLSHGDRDGKQPLHLAVCAVEVSVPVIGLLLEMGAPVDGRDRSGSTALHTAVSRDSLDAVRLLAAHDRLCAATDSDGRLPVHLAAMAGLVEVLVALRGTCTGAHLSHGDRDGKQPLHLAVCAVEVSMPVIGLLLEVGAPVDGRDRSGSAALHYAAARVQLPLVQELLRRGADCMLADNDGKLAIQRVPNTFVSPILGDAGKMALVDALETAMRTAARTSAAATAPAFTAFHTTLGRWSVLPVDRDKSIKGEDVESVTRRADQITLDRDAAGHRIFLGQGTFGAVYAGSFTDADGAKHDAAIKRQQQQRGVDDSVLAKCFWHEAVLHVRCSRHPGVVKCFGAADIPFDGVTARVLVLQRCRQTLADVQHGPMDGRGNRSLKPLSVLTLLQRWDIACALAAAVRDLHSDGLVHNDIKSDNVLMTVDGKALLTDFGTVAFVGAPHDGESGTPTYMCPHVGLQIGPAEHKAWSDVYSFGVLLHELVSGRFPYDGIEFPTTVPAHMADVERRWMHSKLGHLDSMDARRLEAQQYTRCAFYCNVHAGLRPATHEQLAELRPPGIGALIASMWQLDREGRPTMAAVAARLRELRPLIAAADASPGDGGAAESKDGGTAAAPGGGDAAAGSGAVGVGAAARDAVAQEPAAEEAVPLNPDAVAEDATAEEVVPLNPDAAAEMSASAGGT
jgi:ankyrin repeat protein